MEIMTMLQSSSAVIQALGGTTKVADLLEVGSSAISNYRKNGFPPRVCVALAKICAAQNIQVASHVFGLPNIEDTAWRRQAALSGGQAHLELFNAAGFELIETPVLQPADPFIELMGEEMRRRLFTFTDPVGETLCLRPDLTIPTARQYIQQGDFERRQYYYSGTAFRYQPRGAGKPEEFTQIGIEILNADTAMQNIIVDEVKALNVLVDFIRDQGVDNFDLYVNDLELFSAILQDLKLTQRQQVRLRRSYSHGNSLELTLSQLITPPPVMQSDLALEPSEAGRIIAGRSQDEIMARLKDKLEEANAEPLAEETANKIRDLAALNCSVDELRAALRNIGITIHKATDEAIRRFETRIFEITKRCVIEPSAIRFCAQRGRKLAYYTGFAFEICAAALGPRQVIASGGRYDALLSALGAPEQLTAVGGAVSMERIYEAASEQSGALQSLLPSPAHDTSEI
jgi:ATP phosphoribosyltransferase regulatory subunit